jgi:hypothetical protein
VDGRGILWQAARRWVAIVAAWALVVGALPAAGSAAVSDATHLALCLSGAAPTSPGDPDGGVHHDVHDCCLPSVPAAAPPPARPVVPTASRAFDVVRPPVAAALVVVASPERHPHVPRAPPGR